MTNNENKKQNSRKGRKRNGRGGPSGADRKEIAAGLVVFRYTEQGVRFLLLYHGGSYWNFPKGKMESEERSYQTAIRETGEETGLSRGDLRIRRGFKAHEKFTFRRRGKKVFKVVIFYLAEAKKWDITIVPREHQGYAWFSYSKAKKMLGKHKDSQKVLDEAYKFLEKENNKN